MSIYYITGLFLPQDEITFRPITKYIEFFHELAESNIPIGIYLDNRLKDQAETIIGKFKNIQILDYISVDKSFIPPYIVLPTNRNQIKDTIDYMSIQLMKFNLCARASLDDRIDLPNIAWIDFGIFHMIRNKEKVKDFLTSYKVPEGCNKILNPGCWNKGNYDIWNSIAWRFCGSLLIGPRKCWSDAYKIQQEKVIEFLPRLTWEINYWTLMEDVFEWYKADHNDSIILNLPRSV